MFQHEFDCTVFQFRDGNLVVLHLVGDLEFALGDLFGQLLREFLGDQFVEDAVHDEGGTADLGGPAEAVERVL